MTTRGDILTATRVPTLTPVQGGPSDEFTLHVDLTITGGSGKHDGATGTITFDGQGHNPFGGPGLGTFDVIYRGSVRDPNIKAGRD